jgi:hypothetical protein
MADDRDNKRVVFEHLRLIRADKTGLDESERSFCRWMERRALEDEPEQTDAEPGEPSAP